MMGKVTMNTTMPAASATTVANTFIDNYMGDANATQIKVYLYLLRMMQAQLPTSVSDIADRFNDTEKDIMRALTYWEKKGLIGLEFDNAGHLSGVWLEDIPSEKKKEGQPAPAININSASRTRSGRKSKATDEKEDQQLVFLAEQYFGKQLGPTDVQKIFYIRHTLGFSLDLSDYLLQYCAELGKKDFRYMEKVALAWHEAGISTVDEARTQSGRYNDNVIKVMKNMGRSDSPAPAEIAFITKWTDEYGFSQDIIEEACSRAVLSTQNRRFQYADGILKSWHENSVKNLSDIEKLDDAHKASPASAASTPHKSGKYTGFLQNTYDFDQLEKALVKN